jgi:hypothetical protein
VVQIEVLAIAGFAAVLAGVLVTFKDIVPRELHFLLRHVIINQEEDDSWHPEPEADCSDGVGIGVLLRKVLPFSKVERLERTVVAVEHDVGMTLKQKRNRPARRTNVHSLPEAIQYQHVLAQHRTHIPIQLAASYTNRAGVSM